MSKTWFKTIIDRVGHREERSSSSNLTNQYNTTPKDDKSSARNDAFSKKLKELFDLYRFNIGSQDCHKYLHQFLSTYNDKYYHWNSEFEIEFQNSDSYISKTRSIPDIDTDATRIIASLANKYIVKLSSILTEDSPHDHDVIDYLYFLNVVTRNPNNAQQFMGQKALNCPVQIAKLCSLKLTAISEDSQLFYVWWDYLKLLLVNCCHIVANFSNPRFFWRGGEVDTVTASNTMYNDAKSLMVSLGFMKILKEILKFFSNTSVCDTTSKFAFQIFVLHTLGGLVYVHPATQTAFRESEILDCLVDYLGWKKDSYMSAPLELSEKEFQLQLTSLQVIRECIFQNGENVQRLSELGGFEKTMDFVLWVSERFTSKSKGSAIPFDVTLKEVEDDTSFLYSTDIFTKVQSLSAPGRLERPPCKELIYLFQVLYSMCVPVGLHLPPNHDGSQFNKRIINILLDLFNDEIRGSKDNARAREKLKNESPELQLHVLDFFTRLIFHFTETINMATNSGLWDAIFSEYFFLCHSNITDIFQGFREQIILFIQFTATLTTHDNIEECKQILNFFDANYEDMEIVYELTCCMVQILIHNRTVTQKALLSQKFFSVVTGVMVRHQQMRESYESAPENLKQLYFKSRRAVLSLLGHFICDDGMCNYALQDPKVKPTLFALLYEPEMKDLAVCNLVSLMKAIPEEINVQHTVKLFNHYLDLLSQLPMDSTENNFTLLLRLLEGIRQVIDLSVTLPIGTTSRKQKLFVEAGAFMKVVTVLNIEPVKSRLPTLCAEVIKTLTSLLANNAKNKDNFRLNIGYDQLKNVILFATDDHPSRIILDLLFDMLVDGNFSMDNNYIIQNIDVITLIFLLLPSFATEDQIYVCEEFCNLSQKCIRNQSLCCNNHLIYLLLELIPQFSATTTQVKIIHLVEVLGAHSTNVRELKRLFSLLKTESGDFRPIASPLLLKALQNMALSRGSGPEVYFDFNSNKACILLPSIPKWPSKGWTFYTWIRVESYTNPMLKGIQYEPRIFSFLTSEGFGMEAYFDSKAQLTIMSSLSNGKQGVFVFDGCHLAENKWYFITFVHTKPRIGQSEIKLFIDGDLKQKAPLKYPQLANLTMCRVGARADIQLKNFGEKATRDTSFIGQMGAIYMFDDSLSNIQIQSIYNLGPNYLGNFLLDHPLLLKPAYGSLVDGILPKSILLSYNCKAVEGKICVDNSLEGLCENAKLMDVSLCVSQDVKDVIHCLDGIKVILPLFAQLDQPVNPKFKNNNGIDYSIDPKIHTQVLTLLRDMLTGSITNQEEMLRSKGFSTIGFMLQRVAPGHLTVEALTILKEISDRLFIAELLDEFQVSILFDFRLWIYADFNVQKYLLDILLELIKPRPQVYRQQFGVQRILDIIHFFYWDIPEQGALAKEPLYHPVTKDCIGQRPSADKLVILRDGLLKIVKVYLSHEPSGEEIQFIINVLLVTGDVPVLIEIFNMMTEMVSYPVILEYLVSTSATDVLSSVLTNDSEPLRLACLRTISKIMLESTTKNKKSKSQIDFAAVSKIMLTYPFTHSTYSAFSSILVGNFTSDIFEVDDEMSIKLPGLLPIIFKSLLNSDALVRQKILQDIYLLLSKNPSNKEVFLDQVGWENWLFTLLTDSQHDNAAISDILVNIIRVLAVHSLHNVKDGWRVLEKVLSLLNPFGQRGVLNSIDVSRSIFSTVLSSIKEEAQVHGISIVSVASVSSTNVLALLQGKLQEKPSVFMMNLIHLSLLVEDYLFYTPPPTFTSTPEAISYHREDNGNWADLRLARDLNDILDIYKLLNISTFSTIDQIGQFNKSQRRTGGIQRLVLRLGLESMEEAAVRSSIESDVALQICFESVPRIRAILSRDLSSNEPEPMNPRTGYIVHRLIKIVKNCSQNRVKELSKAVVPIIKDIIRKYVYTFTTYWKEKNEPELVEFSAKLAELTIPDFISSFTSSVSQWTKLLAFLDTFSRLTETEEAGYSKLVFKHRTKTYKELQSEVEQLDVKEIEAEKRIETFSLMTRQKTHSIEMARRQNLMTAMQDDTRAVARNWNRILRSLQNERGPWGTTESKVYWKVDKTENFSRMRMKLKKNYGFKDHREAAIEYKPSNAEEQREPTNSLTLSGIKLASQLEEFKEDKTDEFEGEEWALINDNDELNTSASGSEKEKLILTIYCELIKPMNKIVGKLEITTTHLYFKQDRTTAEDLNSMEVKDRKWPLENIREMHLRRYLLRRSALEIFLVDQTNIFLNFGKKDRNKVYSKILSLKPANLAYSESRTPEEILKKSDLTKRWQMRQISNFDYLMQLNTIAGRTYNDLTQYPVFPWVIADYTSEVLDFTNPATFRDLSKPIGALNPDRLLAFIERFNSFDDPVIPKFHYGSHYSSAGAVLFYMVRVEPFTSFFLTLQGGKFDHADRMFHSVAQSWWNCLHGTSDVKELIPEFFYCPEFLVNSNSFNLGVKQNGDILGDVVLPPWAKTPEEFVRINREALESDYVSEHLHEWIDLIFGYKQKGKNAIEAHNMFYYLTYEGAVDMDAIEDEGQRRATEAQINNFGQTPSQLIKKKSHAKRNANDFVPIKSIFATPKLLQAYFLQVASSPLVYIGIPETNLPTLLYLGVTDRIITVDQERTPASHRWLPTTPNAQISPFTFEPDPLLSTKRKIGIPYSSEVSISPLCFDVTNDGRVLLSCGHWDNSFKMSFVDTAKQIQSVVKHKDIVTCLALGTDGKTLITGSKDTTLMVWDLQVNKNNNYKVDEKPIHILYGHDDEITSVAINIELDIAVSGSKDGTCILHTLRRGKYVRSIYHAKRYPIRLLVISNQGHIVLYSQEDLMINLYTINARFVTSVELSERLNHMIVTRNGEYLITGSEKGTVVIRKLFNLQFVHKITVNSSVCSLAMTTDERHLLVGLKDGKLLIITLNEVE